MELWKDKYLVVTEKMRTFVGILTAPGFERSA